MGMGWASVALNRPFHAIAVTMDGKGRGGGSHVISDHMLQIRCNWLVRKATGTEEEMSKEGCWTDGETGNATSLLLHQTLRVD